MQENEKYGIELEAKTSLFKKGLQEAIKYTKAFGQGVKESFSEQVKQQANNWRTALKQSFTDVDYKKELKDIQNQKNAIMEQIKNYRGEGNLQELQAQYNKLDAKMVELNNSQKEYNEELEDTDKTAQKTKSTLSTLFDGSISKIKRFTYYLLGARSVFSLFMRYRSIYYQFNEKMQYQSELSQNAIALSLGPAFEFLGNVIAYASIGLAKFIELLTGVNVLSKVTTKGIRDYNKSLKETQTLVTGIDEITNLTNPQNLGLASQYQALNDFKKKIEEVNKWFEKNPWIKDLADGLKKVWEWLEKIIEDVGGVEGALKLLGGFAVMSAIGKLIGGPGSGLSGVAGLLTTIVGTHVIYMVLKGNADYEKIMGNKAYTKDEKKNFDEIIKKVDKLADKLKTLDKNSKEYKDTVKKINEGWDVVNGTIQLGHEDIINNTDEAEKLAKKLWDITNESSYKSTFDISKKIGLIQAKENAKTFYDKMQEWFTGADKNIDTTKNSLNNLFKEEKNNLKNFEKQLEDVSKKKYTPNIEIKYKIPKSTVLDLIEKARILSVKMVGMSETTFNSIANQVLKKFGYAKGLDYVPYDNYPALLHKGEAVVPAKYNPTIHSQGNEYTNSLLETLIYKVEDLANRPNQFNIDGKDLARVTYPLLEAEKRNYSYNGGVSR